MDSWPTLFIIPIQTIHSPFYVVRHLLYSKCYQRDMLFKIYAFCLVSLGSLIFMEELEPKLNLENRFPKETWKIIKSFSILRPRAADRYLATS